MDASRNKRSTPKEIELVFFLRFSDSPLFRLRFPKTFRGKEGRKEEDEEEEEEEGEEALGFILPFDRRLKASVIIRF